MTENRKKIDHYFSREYQRLLQAANNVLGRESGMDELHSIIVRVYAMDECVVADMAETDYLTFYVIRSLSNAAAQNGRHRAVVVSNERGLTYHMESEYDRMSDVKYSSKRSFTHIYRALDGDEGARTLTEVVERVSESARVALCALVDEIRLNVRLNSVLKYKTQAFDRIVYNKHVVDGITFRDMEKNTGIPKSNLFESYSRVRKKLAAEEIKYKEERQ